MSGDVVDRAKTMVTTIEYAQFHSIGQAYPDAIIKGITTGLIAEVEKLRARETQIRELCEVRQNDSASKVLAAIHVSRILAVLDAEVAS